jgi:hypothetical protein
MKGRSSLGYVTHLREGLGFKMKKFFGTKIASLFAVTAIAMGIGMSAAPKANAFLLFVDASGGYWSLNQEGVLGCIIFLPFCLLDEKAGPQTMTSADLAANGYSAEQIKAISQDQATLMNALASKNEGIKIDQNDTASNVKTELAKIAPGLSDTYVQFLIDNRATN